MAWMYWGDEIPQAQCFWGISFWLYKWPLENPAFPSPKCYLQYTFFRNQWPHHSLVISHLDYWSLILGVYKNRLLLHSSQDLLLSSSVITSFHNLLQDSRASSILKLPTLICLAFPFPSLFAFRILRFYLNLHSYQKYHPNWPHHSPATSSPPSIISSWSPPELLPF